MTDSPLWNALDLRPHELLQLIRVLGICRRLIIVLTAIVKNELRIANKLLRTRVLVLLMLLLHGPKVHGLLDDLVIVGHLVLVDGLIEGPRRRMILHVVEQMQELIVIWPVTRLPCEFVHVGRPTGGLDGRDGHGINLEQGLSRLRNCPIFGRLVHEVTFGKSTYLGQDGFALLDNHLARFQVADVRHHSALHDGTSLVVFDVAHPEVLVERDVLREALLAEIADGVVVGVGQEVLDFGGVRFDEVFEVRHQVCAVAFDLLVR